MEPRSPALPFSLVGRRIRSFGPIWNQSLLVDPRREHAEQVRLDMQAHGLRRPLVLWTQGRSAPRQASGGAVHVWAQPREADRQLVALGAQRFQLCPGGVGVDAEIFGTHRVGRFGFLQLSELPETLRVLPVPEADGLAFLLADVLFTGQPLLLDRRGAGTAKRLLELPGTTRIHAGRALLGEYSSTVEQERQRALGRQALDMR